LRFYSLVVAEFTIMKNFKSFGLVWVAASLYSSGALAFAQATQFDMSAFTSTGSVASGSAINSTADTGQYGFQSSPTGEGQQGMGGLTTKATGKESEVQQTTQYGLLAPGTAGAMTAVPSGSYSFGFGGPGFPTGLGRNFGMLPPTSTSSVDLNIVDQ
jgi:hypothetical protein